GRSAQLAWAKGLTPEIRGHSTLAVDALLEGDSPQVAAEIVAPGVVDALEIVLDVAAVIEGDQRAAVRAAILETIDRAVGVAHNDDRHVADLVGAIIALVGDVGFQAYKIPGGALEQALHLALVVG